MDDLISRQAALNCFHAWIDKHGDVHEPDEIPEYEMIEALPSAQPEIIRCKDCKYWTKQADSLQGRCALFGIYPTGRWYCANAKKKGDPNE